jgi:hypothetical protein
VISDSPLWRSWAGRLVEARGVAWRAFGWAAWEGLSQSGGAPDLLITDGSRAAVPGEWSEVPAMIEAGERFEDPWDPWALGDALDRCGVGRASASGRDGPAAPLAIRSLLARYVDAGRQASRDLAENLGAFRASQPAALAGGDYLAEACEKSRELAGLVDSLERSLQPQPQDRGECPLWPAVEEAFDLGTAESPWRWSDGLPTVLPDVAATRWQLERVLEGLVESLRSLDSGLGAVVHLSARETGQAPWRELALECSGMTSAAGGGGRVSACLVELAARLAACGGRFEESAAGIWRCILPVRPSAPLRRRAEVKPWPRVLVVAPDAVESSVYCQVIWKRGCVVVPVHTVARAATVIDETRGVGFAAALIADGPGAMPDDAAIALGLRVPLVVLSSDDGRARRWLDIPGVCKVIAAPMDLAGAMAAVDAAIAENAALG